MQGYLERTNPYIMMMMRGVNVSVNTELRSDSYRDHSDFLKGSARYASLFNLDPTDYKHWAYGLKKAGYATNPRYPQIIIRLIEEYHLQDYTLIAMGKTRSKRRCDCNDSCRCIARMK